MLCRALFGGTKSRQNQNNISSALWSYKTDKTENNNMFFPISNKQILTFWYPKQSARTALWDLVKIVNMSKRCNLILTFHRLKVAQIHKEFAYTSYFVYILEVFIIEMKVTMK